jgi:2,3-bisphosphoglycerate-independent phosphoglycerate mutase
MKPIVLTIIDGMGIGSNSQINPLRIANIPNFKGLEKNYPGCSLQASGMAIGMPWNEAGNSEVGHMVIGAGRVIYQYLPRISLEIKNGLFFKNPALLKTMSHANKNKSTLHLTGLASSGNVHSYLEHIYALLELARQEKIENLKLHLFTDGKDAPLMEGKKIISAIEGKLSSNPNWKIANIIGRFFAMDRNQNWDRTKKTYNLLVRGIGEKIQNPVKKLEEFYQQDINDTYIEPLSITNERQEPLGNIRDNDAIIFFDFRADSMRQLTASFISERFENFTRQELKNIYVCTMTQYDKKFEIDVAYPPIEIKNNLVEELSKRRKKVLKIAETEKYAHVTYFFNGDREELFPYEDRKMIPSQVISHYDDNPEMQSDKVTDAVIKGIRDKYDLIVVNYASPDMVAHTGNTEAGIKSLEAIDRNIKRLIGMAEYGECITIITSDHGHIEQMISPETGETMTEHTANPVPFFIVGEEFKIKNPRSEEDLDKLYQPSKGIICDIAPTILELMQIPKPSEMNGQSLLKILK